MLTEIYSMLYTSIPFKILGLIQAQIARGSIEVGQLGSEREGPQL